METESEREHAYLSEREARAVMEKVTNVVKYLHQNGVVHRYISFVIVFIGTGAFQWMFVFFCELIWMEFLSSTPFS